VCSSNSSGIACYIQYSAKEPTHPLTFDTKGNYAAANPIENQSAM
jgi:hypothetical protein